MLSKEWRQHMSKRYMIAWDRGAPFHSKKTEEYVHTVVRHDHLVDRRKDQSEDTGVRHVDTSETVPENHQLEKLECR